MPTTAIGVGIGVGLGIGSGKQAAFAQKRPELIQGANESNQINQGERTLKDEPR